MQPQIPSFDVEPKILTQALRAVSAFVSQDETRHALRVVNVQVASKTAVLTATDGHTLCSVSLPVVEVQPGVANLSEETVAKLLTAAKTPRVTLTVNLDRSEHDSFPEFTHDVPTQVDEGAEGVRVFGFDAKYLARLGHVQKCLKVGGCRLQVGATTTEPIRADFYWAGGPATVVVMPRRQAQRAKE